MCLLLRLFGSWENDGNSVSFLLFWHPTENFKRNLRLAWLITISTFHFSGFDPETTLASLHTSMEYLRMESRWLLLLIILVSIAKIIFF